MTDFLYARPSILEGIGRNIDLFGVMNNYNLSNNGKEADAIALASDWAAVYQDLYNAFAKTACQIESKKNGA
jgi:hypothetical protein